ncbi:hypothetical protein CcaverHIS002_0604400 [Cutaneotrichosporon cavernicola]|uniref:Dienelactone hydrolase domain-containing protein n=1 Tax=Cutaneotrichosporon cavernicola TaxID=279322 RepID=A0AA48L8P2_9TREE|nr:uncharacterized protein CcaverHIS019_0603870 [Cutaneotrichosporon cavernicola]BEI86153.1 hypothetical protein CcaverHIS002_0604400 [Cutaneotrichosporon cavernicola]BEI93928.1 hypothetical protein CcaverHIS019_0603870 [Cutaneotrichosporon cavernicola]BEJ01706.1 hypothetical protein CcaverHIS631_0603880 [Cutaneotrichosporon cavernicola]BEJ09473.1 hypothetical protein CcaverHIS641_0603880 [Cutaneotrichosporon cavernicola]
MSLPFVPISECCLRGSKLPGEPSGQLQHAGTTVDGHTLRIDRYYARPAEIKHPKTCVVLFYDVFGFSIHNSKILADTYAAHLGIEVFVPDYIPNPPPANSLDSSIEWYPGSKKDQGWLGYLWSKVSLLKILPYARGILDGQALPLVDKAVADVTDAGYTTVGAVGYCRGGTMVSYLLGKGDSSPLAAGVAFHPEYTPARYPLYTRPAAFVLAEVDAYIYGDRVDEIMNKFGKAPNEATFFKDTAHGFAARPSFEHEPTMKAFHDANGRAEAFLRRNLGL